MFACINEFCHDASGATAIEYGLLAALLSLAAITALTSAGNSLSTIYSNISNMLTNAS
jgi:pilus assembly protein Flp/PilA